MMIGRVKELRSRSYDVEVEKGHSVAMYYRSMRKRRNTTSFDQVWEVSTRDWEFGDRLRDITHIALLSHMQGTTLQARV